MRIYNAVVSYYKYTTETGLEPATAGFEVQRAIHCATRSLI